MADSILTIEGLIAEYGSHRILKGVTTSVNAGEVCALLGSNGAGKSTLFRCCLNLHKPTSGHLHIQGQNVLKLSTKARARLVSYVPQDYGFTFGFTVLDLLLMGCFSHQTLQFFDRKEDIERAKGIAKRFKLADYLHEPISALSGGQRQLVMIARALLQQTPLIILDEPTSNLDWGNQTEVWRLLREIARENQVGVFVCSHDPLAVMQWADKVVILHDGVVLAQGTPHEAITSETLSTIYHRSCEVTTVDYHGHPYPILVAH